MLLVEKVLLKILRKSHPACLSSSMFAATASHIPKELRRLYALDECVPGLANVHSRTHFSLFVRLVCSFKEQR